MLLYPALIDGEEGAYGVVFPDIPGVAAMGDTVENALLNAREALFDYALEADRDGEELAVPSLLGTIETPEGNELVEIPLDRTRTKEFAHD